MSQCPVEIVAEIIDCGRKDILVRSVDGRYYVGYRSRRMANVPLKDHDWIHLDVSPYDSHRGRIVHKTNRPDYLEDIADKR